MKKKLIGWSVFGISISAIIIAFSVPWVNIETINAAGSSAVQPLLSKISTIYDKSDVVTQAGGSGAGINAIANATKDIGMASKNPHILELGKNDDLYKKWKERNIKTITIAWDGMGIIYKPYDNENKTLDINEKNIYKIYKSFAGYETIKYSDLGLKSEKNLIPYARKGGGKESGTADAFYKDSGLNFDLNLLNNKEKEALECGEYGPNTHTTAESNSQAFSFVQDKPAGTIIYLSAGYIINNKDKIENSGFKIATYNGIKINDNKITTGYNWYRPLNLMVSLNENNNNVSEKNKDLINYILCNSNNEKLIKEEGYINLNEKQKLTMTKNNNKKSFWISSDIDLNYSGAKGE